MNACIRFLEIAKQLQHVAPSELEYRCDVAIPMLFQRLSISLSLCCVSVLLYFNWQTENPIRLKMSKFSKKMERRQKKNLLRAKGKLPSHSRSARQFPFISDKSDQMVPSTWQNPPSLDELIQQVSTKTMSSGIKYSAESIDCRPRDYFDN